MSPKTLSRTLAIKERLRQWRRAELHEADAEVARAQDQLAVHAERHAQVAAEIIAEREISANELSLHAEQLAREQRALAQAKRELSVRQDDRETHRERVGEATREVKAIEVLHERVLEEQRRDAGLREQRELDEASSRKAHLK